jgi:hypothetical protein
LHIAAAAAQIAYVSVMVFVPAVRAVFSRAGLVAPSAPETSAPIQDVAAQPHIDVPNDAEDTPMVELSYTPTADDVLAWGRHQMKYAPVVVRDLERRRWSTVVQFACIGVLWAIATRSNSLVALAVVFGAAVVGWALSLWITRLGVDRQMVRLMAEDSDQSQVHSLSAGSDGITMSAGATTTTIAWAGLKHIDDTAEHLFIYLAPRRALSIPKRVGQERIDELLRDIHAHRPDLFRA